MNKFNFITLSFVLLVGASFVSCSDDDAPAYEQVLINDAASAGLNGKVKSVEEVAYDGTDLNEYGELEKNEEPSHKVVVHYDNKGYLLGYDNYEIYYSSNQNAKFRLREKYEYAYDNRYRELLKLYERYYYNSYTSTISEKYGVKTEIVYNDPKGEGTVSKYEMENNTYVLVEKRIYPLTPNGKINEEIFDIYPVSQERVTLSPGPSLKAELVVLEKDGKNNWTKAYYKNTYFDEDGEEYWVQLSSYYERTILYY